MQVEHAPCADPDWIAGTATTGTLGTPADPRTGTFTTYNFEVAQWHTYFAAPVGSTSTHASAWVHNLNVGVCDQGRDAVRKYMKETGKDRRTAIKELFETDQSLFTRERAKHTLFGDAPGSGGHYFPGQPGKTPFSKDWTPKKILENVSDIVTDPSTQWHAQSGGKVRAWAVRDGERIRVVFRPSTGEIVTAFPDTGPAIGSVTKWP